MKLDALCTGERKKVAQFNKSFKSGMIVRCETLSGVVRSVVREPAYQHPKFQWAVVRLHSLGKDVHLEDVRLARPSNNFPIPPSPLVAYNPDWRCPKCALTAEQHEPSLWYVDQDAMPLYYVSCIGEFVACSRTLSI